MLIIQPSAAASSSGAGAIVMAKPGSVLSGYLKCDGSLIDAVVYPALVPFCQRLDSITSGSPIPIAEIIATSSSSNYYGGTYTSQKAFDGVTDWNNGGYWLSIQSNNNFVQAQFSSAKVVNAYRLWGVDVYVKAWGLYGSNDGINWTLIDDRSNAAVIPSRGYQDVVVTSPGGYAYYRIMDMSGNYQYFGVSEIQLYVGAGTTPLYKLPTKSDITAYPTLYDFYIKY